MDSQSACCTFPIAYRIPSEIFSLFVLTESVTSNAPTDNFNRSDDGLTFIVKDTTLFETSIIPQFFKHSKFSSFVRQLNFYGFRKIKYSDSIFGGLSMTSSDGDARICWLRSRGAVAAIATSVIISHKTYFQHLPLWPHRLQLLFPLLYHPLLSTLIKSSPTTNLKKSLI